MKAPHPLLAASLLAALAALAAGLPAQSFRDLMLVRNRPEPLKSFLQVRAGLNAGIADDEDKSNGNEDEFAPGGFVYLHQNGFAGERWVADAYAGRDGFYLGIKDDVFPGKHEQGRMELWGRLFSFYRDGFFDGDDFISTGRYESKEWGARLSYGRELDQKLRTEFGVFYRRFDFDRNSDTAIDYTIPDNYGAYGGRLTVEHNTLTLSRTHGLPETGYIVTLAVEREQNDSNRTFGVTGGFRSSLPGRLWRGEAHAEFYQTDAGGNTWELNLDTQLSDEKDRIYNNDAEKPNGELWVDAQIGYRMVFGESLFVTPFGHVQFLRALDVAGRSSDNEVFFGGGLDVAFALGNGWAIVASYSYLSNPSRPPMSFSDDTFGEHQLFVGLDVTFTDLIQ